MRGPVQRIGWVLQAGVRCAGEDVDHADDYSSGHWGRNWSVLLYEQSNGSSMRTVQPYTKRTSFAQSKRCHLPMVMQHRVLFVSRSVPKLHIAIVPCGAVRSGAVPHRPWHGRSPCVQIMHFSSQWNEVHAERPHYRHEWVQFHVQSWFLEIVRDM
jgi:hypothetical protein